MGENVGGGISLFHSILVQRLEKPHSVYCTDILALVISLIPRPCSQFSEQRHGTSFYYSVALILVTFLTVAWTLFIVSLRTTHRWAQADKGSSRTFSRLTLLEAACLFFEGGSPYLPQQRNSITISAIYTKDEKCVQGGSRDRQVQYLCAVFPYKSFFMLDRNHLAYPTHLIALVSPKFDFHLLLHKHAKMLMVCNLEGSPMSSAYLQGHFDIMRKKI